MGRRRRALEELATRAASAGARREREKTILSVLTRTVRGLLRRDASDAARVVSESGSERALRALAEFVRGTVAPRWRRGLEAPLGEIMDGAAIPTNRGDATLSLDLENPAIAQYFENYLVKLSGQIADGTQEKVTEAIREAQRDGLSVPETARRVETLDDAFGRERAVLIARQELQRSSKGGAFIKAQASGVVNSKTRRSSKDARVRPEHILIDGETVAIGETYSNGESYCGELDFLCRCADEFGLDWSKLEGGAA